MDGSRFDGWTRAFFAGRRSRRGMLRRGLGVSLAGLGVEPALACRRNGKPCGAGRNGGCCSGTCRRGTCRPTRGAAGCTVRRDACRTTPRPCPNNPHGSCIVLDNGKPFCAVSSRCLACAAHADCRTPSGTPGKCVRDCPACVIVNQTESACLYRSVGG